ncbi:methyltransferase domain-containing protein [Saccharopolyspora sp. NPDC047091]|uniref:methyltransferase domain-containing protein n=1 Tax=Saccharopolyspora sp. NPDC047091 TaxID=3155924 RepID=UPI0033C357E1
MTAVFDAVYGADTCWLEMDPGPPELLHPRRWSDEPEAADELVLRRCRGATLDVGCGPGRMTGGLVRHGRTALGVDVSADAVCRTMLRGAHAFHGDVFGPLPGEGRWEHVLLLDGNLGIGGDPRALLRRATELITATGSVLVDAHPPGVGLCAGRARLPGGSWFPWARVGADALPELAAAARLRVRWRARHGRRRLAELVRAER